MQRLPASFVSQLDLVTSVQKEATAWRNLIPPEPWADAVVSKAGDVAAWVGARLESGAYNSSASNISVRKNLQGTRPVPVLGVGERIAYRALSEYVLAEIAPAARSQEDYNNFATGPIAYAYEGQAEGARTLSKSRISYVVEADISSFYQYIDHEMLRRELELQTGRIEAVDYLVQLLNDMQGASYGIPQLIDASDELSEAYARMLERDIIRQGLPTWRYNDDFRIGAASYEAAQGAVEKLSEAARSLGLILNDQKTFISRILTYIIRLLRTDGEEPESQFDPENLVVPSDYEATDEESAEQALRELDKLDLPSSDEDRIDLKRLTSDDLRRLRSAIRKLRKVTNPGALERVVHLYLFAPALTPRLSEYVIDMYPSAGVEVERIWDALAAKSDSLSEWQLVWLTYVARTLGLISSNEDRIAKLKGLLLRGRGGLLHAELSLALSEAHASTFRDLDTALRSEPAPLSPWYALGIKALNGAGLVSQQQLGAVKDSSPLYRILIES